MDFRQRLEQSRHTNTSVDTSAEAEDTMPSPYFATDRSKNPPCLELRLANGSRKAVPYAYINEIGFDVDTGIEILISQKKITITGRNLMRLFEHLVAYRVRFVKTDTGDDVPEDGVFVEQIGIADIAL